MAPPKKPFEAASAKAYAEAQGIKRFFAVIQLKKKAGRPPKKRKKNGVIAANTSANAIRDSPPMVNVLTSSSTVNAMVNTLTSPPTVNVMVNTLTSPLMVNVMVNTLPSPPNVNVMVNVLTSPPTVNALTTLKKTRINWGKGEHRDLLTKAIRDWLNEEGDAIDENGEEILEAHLILKQAWDPPANFLQIYLHEEP